MGMWVHWVNPPSRQLTLDWFGLFSRLISVNELNVGEDIQLHFKPQDGLDLKDERREHEDAWCLFIILVGFQLFPD